MGEKAMFDRPDKSRQTRSVVYATGGMVATSQPLAVEAGVDVLKAGGNAFDAAVAAAATLCVVEPMMTGLGGDMFALIYDQKKGKVMGLNASGRAPKLARAALFRAMGYDHIPYTGIYSVTVPGVVDGWAELLEKYGTMTFKETLASAIHYAEHGFPVSEMVSYYWNKGIESLDSDAASEHFLMHGAAPKAGTVFKQPDLARTLKMIAKEGRDAFYCGAFAETMERFMIERGGLIRKEDLMNHRSSWVEPISTNYRGYDILEIPPNGQGLVVLEMLNMLEKFDVQSLGHNSAALIHLFSEVKKRAYADRDKYIADSDFAPIPVAKLLSKEYASRMSERLKFNDEVSAYKGKEIGGDTVYLTVVDHHGNVASVTNSLYNLFGSGEVVTKTGVILQNRGALFSLDPAHLNVIAPGKRPFHTIIPSMVLREGKPVVSFGVMGADMQPQGQVQVLMNLIDFGMNIQEAGEAPRFRHYNEGLFLENGISQKSKDALKRMGYHILTSDDGDSFGVGGYQGIQINDHGVLQGGSDPRKDGCAIGF